MPFWKVWVYHPHTGTTRESITSQYAQAYGAAGNLMVATTGSVIVVETNEQQETDEGSGAEVVGMSDHLRILS